MAGSLCTALATIAVLLSLSVRSQAVCPPVFNYPPPYGGESVKMPALYAMQDKGNYSIFLWALNVSSECSSITFLAIKKLSLSRIHSWMCGSLA